MCGCGERFDGSTTCRASTTVAMSFSRTCCNVNFLYMNSMSVLITTILCRARRDGPELKRDENGQVAEVRLPSKLSTAMSFLTVIASVFLGVSLGGTFSQLIGNRFLIRETWMVSAVQCSM